MPCTPHETVNKGMGHAVSVSEITRHGTLNPSIISEWDAAGNCSVAGRLALP